MKKKLTVLLTLLLCLTLMLTACGGAASDSAAANVTTESVSYDKADLNFSASTSSGGYASDDGGTSADLENRKVILSANLEMETTEFDASITLLEQRVAEMGGWIESSELQGSSRYDSSRYAWYTLRIPAEKLTTFLNGAGEIGNVLYSKRGSEEVTEQYYDVEARLTSLKVQEERLLAILEKAEKLEDIIQLESALTDVRYEIEDLTGTLNRYDSLIEMSTVHVSISEVSSTSPVSTTPKTLGERIAQQFRRSLGNIGDAAEDFLVFLIGNLPVIAVWAVVIVAVVFVVRAVRKRRGDKKIRFRRRQDKEE